MPLPPIGPLGPDILWWILTIIITVIIIGGIIWFLKYIFGETSTFLPTHTAPTPTKYDTRLENIMSELLEEIRLLRKEIAELRKEMSE